MTDKDKRGSQYERLKASGQLVYEKEPGTVAEYKGRLIWLPRTVAEYKEVADTIVRHTEVDELFEAPEIKKVYFYASSVFENAVGLVQWSREPDEQRVFGASVYLDCGGVVMYRVRHVWIHCVTSL